MIDDLWLSPHADDAVLSGGATIAAQVDAGRRVLVVTACVRPATCEADLAEDRAAAAILGCTVTQLDFPEAPARLRPWPAPGARRRLRAAWLGLCGHYPEPIPYDPLPERLAIALARLITSGTTVHAPLGIGCHPDHLAAFRAALALGVAVRWYEDLPYACRADLRQARLTACGGDLRPKSLPVAVTWERKRRAVACYASQLPALFAGDPDAVLAAHGERLWDGVPGGP
jgi:LmbE family N-acetylglucosaminyl deacetylase